MYPYAPTMMPGLALGQGYVGLNVEGVISVTYFMISTVTEMMALVPYIVYFVRTAKLLCGAK